jgi:hypothetical protein
MESCPQGSCPSLRSVNPLTHPHLSLSRVEIAGAAHEMTCGGLQAPATRLLPALSAPSAPTCRHASRRLMNASLGLCPASDSASSSRSRCTRRRERRPGCSRSKQA